MGTVPVARTSKGQVAMNCPKCNDPRGVFVNRTTRHGEEIRRNMVCTSCNHRWLQCNGDLPVRTPAPRLTDEQVAEIISHRNVGHGTMARKFNKSREIIRSIRYGKLYRTVCPDLERWDPAQGCATCLRCANWRDDHCGFGFPDPIEEGLMFARECLQFQVRA